MTGSHRRFKDAIHGHLARVGTAAAGPKRLELLDLVLTLPDDVEVYQFLRVNRGRAAVLP